MMPRLVYEKFVRGYTEKQWGVAPRTLSAALARRFDVREDDDPRLVRHKHQGLPEAGYSGLMRGMLDGVPTIIERDYLRERDAFRFRKLLIFTGPIDEFFGFDGGRLKYRGQAREHEYRPDLEWAQPAVQVNNPDSANGPHIRTLEWKHLLPGDDARSVRGTVLTREVTVTPSDPNAYEYPFPDDANARLYREYRRRADALSNVMICGRLGEYRYYDMDQAIGRAMMLAGRILGTGD